MLSLLANAGMSQKMRPSANNALSLAVSSLSLCFCSSFFFFLNLLLSSASSQSNFSCSLSGEIWLIGTAFPVVESRATNVKLATSAGVFETLGFPVSKFQSQARAQSMMQMPCPIGSGLKDTLQRNDLSL